MRVYPPIRDLETPPKKSEKLDISILTLKALGTEELHRSLGEGACPLS